MSSVRFAPGSCSEGHRLSHRLRGWGKARMLVMGMDMEMGIRRCRRKKVERFTMTEVEE
jgi:hypothetical protein